MTVYVDDAMIPARVGRLYSKWSHLHVGPFDDVTELHEFALRLGLQKRWFQNKPWPRAHYDVVQAKRLAAISAGAVPITWRDTGLQIVRAVDAWKAATGGQPRPTVVPPPGQAALWEEAAQLYEMALTRASMSALNGEGI